MIYISHSTKTKKILLQSSISNQKVIKQLSQELNCIDDNDFSYEITFIDFMSVPLFLLKSMYKIKDKIKITTTQRSLSAYLSKLGLKNKYVGRENSVSEFQKTKALTAVAIGGSAGSLEKLMPIIESLPYADISIFIIIHIPPDRESCLCEILQRVTKYKVYEATHNMKVDKNSIYVAQPNNHLVVVDGHIYLEGKSKINFARPSIDVTFKSLAYEYKETLLAILLCGYGNDGSSSLQDLKNNGVEILIEDPKECEAKDMLLNAIETKNYSRVLHLRQIISYVKSSLSVNIDIKDEMDLFLDNIFVIYGHDFRDYERGSLQRRIELIMGQNFIYNFKEFEIAVMKDEQLFGKLLRAFSINLTSFFRNPEVFKDIKYKIIPKLENISSIRVWCAGCSKGNEPYSIAMLLDEAGLLSKSQIYATDFNDTILQEAKNGLFEKKELDEFEKNYKQSGGSMESKRWFNTTNDFIEIKDEIRDKVLFFKHNLVTDSSINEFDLVLCRNVIIYFNEKLQKRVYNTFSKSLKKDGFLVLGESEMMPKEYGYTELGNKVYMRGNS